MTVQAMLPRLLLAAGPLLACAAAQAGPMQDIGTASAPQCAGLDVNDNGYVVGGCAEADGSTAGFVALAPGGAVDLARLPSARNCAAGAITNSGRILGSCLNADSLSTAVYWNAAAPTTIQSLQPLLGGMRSQITAFNQGGVVAGVSLSANGIAQPVMWRNSETNARSLPAGLLGLDATNCVPSDVDNAASNPAMPGIVGNCPGANGKPQPIHWSGLLGVYAATVLASPAGATYCSTSHVFNARILGNCDFGTQGKRAVVWPTAGAAPVVLASTPLRNRGVGLNAHGAVIGYHQTAGGNSIPFYWDTVTNTRTDIAPLGGGFHVQVRDIGDNGVVVGTGDLADGSQHAFKWTLAGGTVDLGTLAGGENSAAGALSQDGCFLTGSSEVASGHDTHAFLQNVCVP